MSNWSRAAAASANDKAVAMSCRAASVSTGPVRNDLTAMPTRSAFMPRPSTRYCSSSLSTISRPFVSSSPSADISAANRHKTKRAVGSSAVATPCSESFAANFAFPLAARPVENSF